MEHTLGNIILERKLFIISQLPTYLQVTDMCLDCLKNSKSKPTSLVSDLIPVCVKA